MKAVRKRNETSVIGQIGEDLLSWVRSFFPSLYLKMLFPRMTEGEVSEASSQLIGTEGFRVVIVYGTNTKLENEC